ncbi:Lymphoid enhancer-binding factor 1 [Larimichthys crocea]|uniref:Lymphoid enhancer-binding factor 1 n=2 Tax=Larimichthys crocea TaxID=215358 RepID=A0A6G0II72_LARCR|nr:Lymphoid enhancer-binding factor 1 [Larimichthys crocea]
MTLYKTDSKETGHGKGEISKPEERERTEPSVNTKASKERSQEMADINSELSDEFNQLITELNIEVIDEFTTIDMKLFRENIDTEPVEPELQENTHSQEQERSQEMADINSELSDEFNQLITEFLTDEPMTVDIKLFSEIMDIEPVEPELQENTHSQEQERSQEMADINSELSDEFNQLITELNIEVIDEFTTIDMKLFREIMDTEPVEPELQENTHSQEQERSQEMADINSELSDEFNQLITELNIEVIDEFTTIDMKLFREIMDTEPVEPELQENTHSQEQDISDELEDLIRQIKTETTVNTTIDNDVNEILSPDPAHLHTNPQADTHGQEQYNVPLMLPEGLICIGILNGQPVYGFQSEIVTPPVSAPQPSTSNSKKRKRESAQEDDAAEYIKKPPNAFMIYMKEQRPFVEAELNTRGTAAVNTVLGQRWKSLTKEEQAKYYEQAQNLKEIHVQQHPEWSNKNNYGTKKKRIRGKRNVPKAEESASRPETQTDEVPSCSWHNAPNTAQTPLPYPADQMQRQGPNTGDRLE